MADNNSIQEFSTDLLRIYYDRLFPFRPMFDWLSYGNDPARDDPRVDRDFFFRREWSFTLQSDDREEIYVRYQSFRDDAELKAAIKKSQPHKIDIGAVFTASPKLHNSIKPEQFKTVERELVFDIDMTDYDSIRVCCKGAEICRRCWPYMTMALKIIDHSLRQDFAFRNIVWFYSGRRGIHCWVCDPEARSLPNDARAAVVDYLSVEVGSSENSDKNLKSTFRHPIHPMIKRSYDLLEPFFEKYIADERGQGLFGTKERYMPVLNALPDETIRKELYNEWEQEPILSGAERWRRLKAAITNPNSLPAGSAAAAAAATMQKKRKIVSYVDLDAWRMELVFTNCYPRLDANVSKQQNHLLKSPFCVHPKTGRVCVPIDPQTADEFDPFTVPTLRTLCKEIDEYAPMDASDAANAVSDIEKTSLRHAVATFERCFMKGLNSSIRAQFKEKAERAAASVIDF